MLCQRPLKSAPKVRYVLNFVKKNDNGYYLDTQVKSASFHCFPASVRRYFCKWLLGLSGMVNSIDFLSISSLIVRLKAPVLLLNPSILVNSLVERGRLPSGLKNGLPDWALDWAPNWASVSGRNSVGSV